MSCYLQAVSIGYLVGNKLLLFFVGLDDRPPAQVYARFCAETVTSENASPNLKGLAVRWQCATFPMLSS
jgi:hypothetical protein